MYGLKPTDIEYLKHLRNAQITQICVGLYDIQFNFHPRDNVSVQEHCELLDGSGAIVDVWEENTRAGMFRRFPEILMTAVVAVINDTPNSFVLKFANEMSLRVIDNDEHYESFSVGNLYV